MNWLKFGVAGALALLGVVQSWAEVKVLGKLGQALKSAPIYSQASSKSRLYYRAKPYEYLVVRTSDKPGWHKILMSNGKDGYVKEQFVAKLPYEVTYDPAKAPSRTPDRTQASSNSRAAIANYGLNFIGTPYKWGGNDIQNGIDCSGFVKKLYGTIGVDLPRVASEQAKVGKKITRLEDLQPGDRLYFWETKRNKIGHTGIYLGGGYFVHSSSGKGGVTTDYLSEKWRKILVAARR